MTFISITVIFATVCVATYSLDVHFNLDEESPVGYRIGNLFRQLPSNKFLTHGNSEFQAMTTADASYFRVDRQTGDIYVNKKIDLETLSSCRHSLKATKTCQLKFGVNVLQGVNKIIDMLDIFVHVADINDNGCQFNPGPSQTVTFRENDRPNEVRKVLFKPFDPDRNYSITKDQINWVADNHLFGLEIVDSLSTTYPYNLRLILKGNLDYEAVQKYHLKLRAGDGKSGHECFLKITVEIQDVNDNLPYFPNRSVTVDVAENMNTDTPFVTVNAKDKDSGENGRIIYELSPFTDETVRETFYVDEGSGAVKLKIPLNYDNMKSYVVPIIARNPDSRTRFDETKIYVMVIDFNNNRPIIIVFGRTGSSAVVLEEEVTDQVDVASVTVTDADSGLNGEVECALKESENPASKAFSLTPVGNSPGKYKVSKLSGIKFDRESTSVSLAFVIFCQDKGTPTLSTEKRVNVELIDINDHTPTFDKSTYEVEVVEDNDPSRVGSNYLLLQLKADDLDGEDNGKVEYRLEAPNSLVTGMVKVNKKTGEIFSTGNLDREKLETFSFKVVAADNGKPQKSATATISVVVRDYNDHHPRFLQKEYNFEIEENSEAGSLVGILRAEDLDLDENQRLTFNIQNDISNLLIGGRGAINTQSDKMDEVLPEYASKLFRITPRPKKLSNKFYEIGLHTTRSLDREALIHAVAAKTSLVYPVYVLQIVAKDNGQNPLQSTVSVHVQVRDRNDETPRFKFPNGNSSSVHISFLESVDFPFTRVLAVDNDAGENGSLSYFIHSGSIASYFSMDPGSGQIRLEKELSETMIGTHRLVIRVSDNGKPPLSNQTHLFINIDRSAPLGRKNGLFIHDNLSDSATNLYIIIAIVVASFVIAVVLLSAICIVLKKSRRSNNRIPDYKANGDYPVYPMNGSNFALPYSAGTMPSSARSVRREVTFKRAPSLDQVALGPLKPPPYHSGTNEEYKRNSLTSADRDSGNGDSVDVNSTARYLPCGQPGGALTFTSNLSNTGSGSYGHSSNLETAATHLLSPCCQPQDNLCSGAQSPYHMGTFPSTSSGAGYSSGALTSCYMPLSTASGPVSTFQMRTFMGSSNSSLSRSNYAPSNASYNLPPLPQHRKTPSQTSASPTPLTLELSDPHGQTPHINGGKYTALNFEPGGKLSSSVLDNNNAFNTTSPNGTLNKKNLEGSFV